MSEIIKRRSRHQLPGFMDTVVVEKFMNPIFYRWNVICILSFNAVQSALKNLMEWLCDEYFSRFKDAGLLQAVK